MNLLLSIVMIARLLLLYAGWLGGLILPAYWAYNVAKRGDSFGYALLTFFGNALLISLAIWLIISVLDRIIKWILFRPE